MDNWQNTTAATSRPRSRPVSRRANSRTLPDKSDTVVSPRAAVLYHVSDKVSAFGSIGSGFRAPTLNELYRQFRVGAILTLANDQLGPERLVGGELGVNVAPSRLHVQIQLVRQPRGEPGRQRHRPASTPSSARISADADLGLAERRRVPHQPRRGASAPATCSTQAKVTEFAANPALVGLYLPQVPEHRGSVNVAYANPQHRHRGG